MKEIALDIHKHYGEGAELLEEAILPGSGWRAPEIIGRPSQKQEAGAPALSSRPPATLGGSTILFARMLRKSLWPIRFS